MLISTILLKSIYKTFLQRRECIFYFNKLLTITECLKPFFVMKIDIAPSGGYLSRSLDPNVPDLRSACLEFFFGNCVFTLTNSNLAILC